MVFRLVGIIGLTLLSLAVSAAPLGVHAALDKWLRDGGVRNYRYQAVGSMDRPSDWPGWLLVPAGADALNRAFLDRGLFPETVSLDWRRGSGAVLIFGSPPGQPGMQLIVDRDRQRPLVLRTAAGVTWTFTDYRSRPGRHTGIPGRIVRLGPYGVQTVLTPR